MSMQTNPKVSVGIPTYNRPSGLLRTIQQITAQTYTNLEIIISNNASTDVMVAAVANQCAKLDPRIKVINQPVNLGLVRNFKFVLQTATSDYFMWAADDDEWDTHFIETCVEHMVSHDVGTVMPGFQRHFRALNRKGVAQLPKMEGKDRFGDVMSFYACEAHSMFYGLHRKSSIAWYMEEEDSLNDDEYFLMRQILNHGILTVPEKVLFVAGIDDAGYNIKFREAPDRYFFWCKRLLNFAALVNDAQMLSDHQKMVLLQKVVLRKLGFVSHWESGMRDPAQYALAQSLMRFIEQIDFRQLDTYTALMKNANLISVNQGQK